VASLLTLLAVATLVLKKMVERTANRKRRHPANAGEAPTFALSAQPTEAP
jgi:hypothetical protein